MLKIRKTINISGNSSVNGVDVMLFTASIEEDAPENMTINYFQASCELYKENREICRADQKEFEEYVYALQDELLAEIGGTEDGTEE